MAGILPQPLKSLNVQKIAVLRRNGIGDLLTCIPMLRECRRQYPLAHLTLIIEKRAYDCALAIESAPWDSLWVMEPGHKYMSAWKLIKKLRSQSFDLVISAKPTPMKLNALIVGLSGARQKNAVCHQPKKWYEWPVNHPVKLCFTSSFEHQSLQTLAIISDNPSSNPDDWPRFKFVSKQTDSLPSCPKVYLNMTNNRESSRLGIPMMISALKRLKRPLHLIFGGLKSDQSLIDTWYNAFEKEGFETRLLEKRIGESFESTCQLLCESDVIVTGDGGLMHMAAACNRPVLALFGQTSVAKWRPLSSKAQVLYHPERVDAIDSLLIAQLLESLIQKS